MRETQISKTEGTLENMYTQWENIPAVYNFLILTLVKSFFFFECRPRLLIEVSKDQLKNSCMENVFILWVNVHNFLEILNIKANLIMYKKSEYLIPSALHPVFSALFFLFSCTPQYRYLNELQKTYGEAYGERQPEGKKHCRLQIYGFPCNQFRYQAKYTNFTYFFNSI